MEAMSSAGEPPPHRLGLDACVGFDAADVGTPPASGREPASPPVDVLVGEALLLAAAAAVAHYAADYCACPCDFPGAVDAWAAALHQLTAPAAPPPQLLPTVRKWRWTEGPTAGARPDVGPMLACIALAQHHGLPAVVLPDLATLVQWQADPAAAAQPQLLTALTPHSRRAFIAVAAAVRAHVAASATPRLLFRLRAPAAAGGAPVAASVVPVALAAARCNQWRAARCLQEALHGFRVDATAPQGEDAATLHAWGAGVGFLADVLVPVGAAAGGLGEGSAAYAAMRAALWGEPVAAVCATPLLVAGNSPDPSGAQLAAAWPAACAASAALAAALRRRADVIVPVQLVVTAPRALRHSMAPLADAGAAAASASAVVLRPLPSGEADGASAATAEDCCVGIRTGGGLRGEDDQPQADPAAGDPRGPSKSQGAAFPPWAADEPFSLPLASIWATVKHQLPLGADGCPGAEDLGASAAAAAPSELRLRDDVAVEGAIAAALRAGSRGFTDAFWARRWRERSGEPGDPEDPALGAWATGGQEAAADTASDGDSAGRIVRQLPDAARADTAVAVHGDQLQVPLQPLADHLSGATYAAFERDAPKYGRYYEAIRGALARRRRRRRGPAQFRTIIVLGAGRGPLVQAALRATAGNGKIRILAVEKSPHAAATLRCRLRGDAGWCAARAAGLLEVVEGDGRDTATIATLLSDSRGGGTHGHPTLVVSELLGSVGDNELSPECIDPLLSALAQHAGAAGAEGPSSIPTRYVAFAEPVASSVVASRVARDVGASAAMAAALGAAVPGSAGSVREAFHAPYVVLPQQCVPLCDGGPLPCWTFDHGTPPLRVAAGHYERCCELRFTAAVEGPLGGVVGYFAAQLLTKTPPRSVGGLAVQPSEPPASSWESILAAAAAEVAGNDSDSSSSDEEQEPRGVRISTLPGRQHTADMHSWFPLFLPLTCGPEAGGGATCCPVVFPGNRVVVRLSRRHSSPEAARRVWYEWQATVSGEGDVVRFTTQKMNSQGEYWSMSLDGGNTSEGEYL